jgi:hypothetical protein
MQVASEIILLQQQEDCLRDCERRLRGLLQLDDKTEALTTSAIARRQDSALMSSWERYEMARNLLKSARQGFTKDRLALREYEELLKGKETELRRREAWIKVREAELDRRSKHHSAPTAGGSFPIAPYIVTKTLFRTRR